VVDQTALVQAVVSSFNAALSAHDVSRMQAAWPSMKSQDAKKWQDFFKNFSSAKVSQSCPVSSLVITGDNATWSCSVTTVIPGSNPQPPHGFNFALAKKNGSWVVTDWR
jgi:hypothetical protein